jgi:hypothetical protein
MIPEILADDRSVLRLLARLARPGAMLAPDPRGGTFALYPSHDRRRRPPSRVPSAMVEALAREGALAEREGGAYVLSPAGYKRNHRIAATPDESWRSQHEPVGKRAVIGDAGVIATIRGLDAGPAQRLARLRDASGACFFSPAELAAAARIAADWAMGQQGLLRGSDWTAPPRGGTPRSAGGVEAGRAATLDSHPRGGRALGPDAPGGALDQCGVL